MFSLFHDESAPLSTSEFPLYVSTSFQLRVFYYLFMKFAARWRPAASGRFRPPISERWTLMTASLLTVCRTIGRGRRQRQGLLAPPRKIKSKGKMLAFVSHFTSFLLFSVSWVSCCVRRGCSHVCVLPLVLTTRQARACRELTTVATS